MSEQEADQSVDAELTDMYAQLDEATSDLEPSGGDAEDHAKPAPEDPDSLDGEQDGEPDGEGEGAEEKEHGEYAEPSEEEKAREKGWKPKEEYDGDPDQWVSAGEFNRRTELFDKISTQNKQLKSLKKQLDALAKHTKTVAEKTREQTIAELKQQQRDAVAVGDVDAFEEAEKAIGEAEKEGLPEFEDDAPEADEAPEAPQNEVPPAVKEFASRNAWFEKDQEMTDYMLFQTEKAVRNRGLPLDDAIAEAEKAVKSTFAHKFRNPKKDKPAPVMSGNRGQDRSPKVSLSNLTPEQKQVWHALKGTMTEKEFLEQLETLT